MKIKNIHRLLGTLALLAATLLPSATASAQSTYYSELFESDVAAESVANGRRPLYHENDNYPELINGVEREYGSSNLAKYPIKYYKLKRRLALTGEDCTINKLINVVGVGAGQKNLGNMLDDDLENYAEFPTTAGVGLGDDPFVSVRDHSRYYAMGTEAGFCIVASSNASLLSLNVISMMTVLFYRDGELVGSKTIDEGQAGSGIGLKVAQLPGSDNANILLSVKAPGVFDEIALAPGGVNVDAVKNMKIKYAFVGKSERYAIANCDAENTGNCSSECQGVCKCLTLEKYNQAQSNFYGSENWSDIKIDKVQGWNPVLLGIPFPWIQKEANRLISCPCKNEHGTLSPILAVGYQGGAKFMCSHENKQGEAFEAGQEVGFKVVSGSGVDLGVGTWVRIILFDRNGNKVQEETIEGKVLGLSLGAGGDGTSAITAQVPFSGAEIRLHTVLALDLGAIYVYNAFVANKPEIRHHCEINPTMDTNLCAEQNTLQLQSNEKVPVEWEFVSSYYINDEGHRVYVDNNLSNIEKTVDSDNSEKYRVDAIKVSKGGYVEYIRPLIVYEHDEEGNRVQETDYNGNLLWLDAEGDTSLEETEWRKYLTYEVAMTYVFRAKAADGCEDFVAITSGGFGSMRNDGCQQMLYNPEGEDIAYENQIYRVGKRSEEKTGSLLTIEKLENASNVVDGQDGTYAEYTAGLSAANNLCIVGVHQMMPNPKGHMYEDEMYMLNSADFDDATYLTLSDDDPKKKRYGKKRIGFVVSMGTSVLDLKLLEFFQIRVVNTKGEEVFRKVISESNGVSAKLIGNNEDGTKRIRYSIDLDDFGNQGDYKNMHYDVAGFELWKSGVLDLGFSDAKIYYAFIEDASNDCDDPLGCGATILSADMPNEEWPYDGTTDKGQDNMRLAHTHTTINASETQFGGAVEVGMTITNIDNFIDYDPKLETAMVIANPVTVGAGLTIAVKMGRTLDFHHQLGIAMDSKTYLAGIDAGNWLTIETYYQGEATGDKKDDWKVLGADVAGYGDKNFLFMQPKFRYDEVRITIGGVAGVLKFQNFFGMFLRGDVDNDGIPDCEDYDSCKNNIDGLSITPVCEGEEVVVTVYGPIDTDFYCQFPDDGTDVEGKVEDTQAETETEQSRAGFFALDQYVVVKRTTNDKGVFEVKWTADKSGRFQFIVYDGTKTPLTTVEYMVHPTRTEWRVNPINDDWKQWDNWTNGTPYCCTDVVIPSNARIYPVLYGTNNETDKYDIDVDDDFCAKGVHFEPAAYVGNIGDLNYEKAWVEIELEPNKYHLLSAPLKWMYTGDMYLPAGTDGSAPDGTDYFTEWKPAENRFNPSIYQRFWSRTMEGRIWTKGETAEYKEVGTDKMQWSRTFNHLAEMYTLGQGFSLWVDNGDCSADRTFRFRFPKAMDNYTYYSDYDQSATTNSEDIARSKEYKDGDEVYDTPDEVGRFIYEENARTRVEGKDEEGKETIEYKLKYKTWLGGEVLTVKDDKEETTYKYTRRLYDIPESIVLTNTNEGSAKTEDKGWFTFGNPFMSEIDVLEFLKENIEKVVEIKFYDGETSTTAKLDGEALAAGSPEKIAPSVAVLVKAVDGAAKDNGTTLTVSINEEMINPAYVAPSTEEPSPTLIITATTPAGLKTHMSVTSNEELTSELLLDNEVAPRLVAFGMDNETAQEIVAEKDVTPLGFYCTTGDTSLTLSFQTFGGFDRDLYVIEDMLTGMVYPLDHDIEIEDFESSVGRYVLTRATTEVKKPVAEESSLFITMDERTATATSLGTDIVGMTLYSLNGDLLDRMTGLNAQSATIELWNGVQILRVELADGSVKSFKLLRK